MIRDYIGVLNHCSVIMVTIAGSDKTQEFVIDLNAWMCPGPEFKERECIQSKALSCKETYGHPARQGRTSGADSA